MALDKAKTLRAAEKYLEMGKIPAAIKEYCQIVESEPDDFNALNMLGDLYARVGNQQTAISCFRRIAEHYREQDFGLKAIAMFRKIDRLQPNDTEIATSLADLYAEQDLVVEARAHYLAVADAHNRSGATREALDVLRKIADLDPQNTEIRTKLGDGYLKEGLTKEAAASFTEAGQNLLARGAVDSALEVFGKALEIHPAAHESLKGLLTAHSARGTADEAAEVIEQASTDNPDDVELLSMLASAYVEADDPTKAERATESLVSQEPSAYLRFIDVARSFLTNDKLEDAARVVAGIAEQMLAEREEHQLLELVNELLTCDSDNVQALRLLVRTYWWQRDTEKLKAALERMAEAAEAAGLEKDERYALTQLTRLVPDQTHHVERLNQLGGAEEAAATEALPEFETVPDTTSACESGYEHELDPENSQFVLDSQTHSPSTDEAEFEWNSVADVTGSWTEPGSDGAIERGFTFEAVVAEELPSRPEDEVVITDSGDQSRNVDVRSQELESVDFYIAQGYVDIALDTLALLERQFGPHEDIETRRRHLDTVRKNGHTSAGESRPLEHEAVIAGTVPEIETVSAPVAANVDAGRTNHQTLSSADSQGIDPGLAEVFEEYRMSAESEGDPGSNGDYETHYNLGLAYKDMDLFEEALEEFQIAVRLVTPDDGTPRYLQCCNLLGHCFMKKGVPQLALQWFNKGLSAPGVAEDQRQALRYEIGAAYEQAGDLNRAIAIFTELYGIDVSYRGVNERLRALQARVNGKQGKAQSGHKHAKHKKQR